MFANRHASLASRFSPSVMEVGDLTYAEYTADPLIPHGADRSELKDMVRI